MTDTSNADQKEFWSHTAGPKWLAHQAALDMLMQPVLDAVLARAGLTFGDAVLDIGCGTGASTLQAADLVGPSGHVLGADISDPMLARARERAAGRDTVRFLNADAATHDFEDRFDHLISRFGVMFFDDPVGAFANMARALKPGAWMTFASWGQIPANPFFTLPARVARGILGAPPKVDPDQPGPFAFRDPERVIDILVRAGLTQARCEVVNLDLTPEDRAEAFAGLVCSIGPADATMTHFNASADQRVQLKAALVEALAEFDGPDGLRVPAEINVFQAQV